MLLILLLCDIHLASAAPTDHSVLWHHAYGENKKIYNISFVIEDMRTDSEEGPQRSDVVFTLFNRSMPVGLKFQLLDGSYPGKTIGLSLADRSLFVIIHGFTETGEVDWILNMKNVILKANPYSYVLVVDWGLLSAGPWYASSAEHTEYTGTLLYELINHFHKDNRLALSQVHLIGFSLGSHVAAVAGHKINAYGESIGRITGLDPAYPLFGNDDLARRLDKTDAAFVDVIHTNAAYVITSGLGYPIDIGHIDFWPNGGNSQVGCGVRADPIDVTGACSHKRAHEYYTETILNADGYGAVKCDSWSNYLANKCRGNKKATMGMYVNKSTRGRFYLRTHETPPFAIM